MNEDLAKALARAEKAEKELAETKKELDQVKHSSDMLAKEYLEAQHVTIAVMTMVPEINERVKALTPEQIQERTEMIRQQLKEKTEAVMRRLQTQTHI